MLYNLMKKLGYLICIFSFQITMGQTTENNCACCTEKYNQFDFWLGEWNVYDSNEKLIGINSIIKGSGSCLILEKWVEDERRGSSTVFYNSTDDSWNQIWVDNSDFVLKLKGNFVNGIMTLKSELIEGNNKNYYNQISWIQNEDGSITQLWEIYDEHYIKISEVFQGIYKKTLN